MSRVLIHSNAPWIPFVAKVARSEVKSFLQELKESA